MKAETMIRPIRRSHLFLRRLFGVHECGMWNGERGTGWQHEMMPCSSGSAWLLPDIVVTGSVCGMNSILVE